MGYVILQLKINNKMCEELIVVIVFQYYHIIYTCTYVSCVFEVSNFQCFFLNNFQFTNIVVQIEEHIHLFIYLVK